MFCICVDSPVGLVVVKAPAVVEAYKICPSDTLDVSKPSNVPNVATCNPALLLASVTAKPNTGILELSSAFAFATIGTSPETPET